MPSDTGAIKNKIVSHPIVFGMLLSVPIAVVVIIVGIWFPRIGTTEEGANIAAAVFYLAFALAASWLVWRRMKSSRIATLCALFGLFAAVATYALAALSHYPRPTSLEIALSWLSLIICPSQLLLLVCPDCDTTGWSLVITYSVLAPLNAGLYVLMADGIMRLRKSRPTWKK